MKFEPGMIVEHPEGKCLILPDRLFKGRLGPCCTCFGILPFHTKKKLEEKQINKIRMRCSHRNNKEKFFIGINMLRNKIKLCITKLSLSPKEASIDDYLLTAARCKDEIARLLEANMMRHTVS